MASVLITGGAGYIGSHVAHALVERGEQVTVLDSLETGCVANVPDAARLVEGDIGDAALVQLLIAETRPDAVIHLAGSSVVPDSCAKPLDYFDNNTAGSLRLIREAVAGGVDGFVFSSTAAVYGSPETPLVDETAVLKPISPYGASKAMVERILADVAEAHGMSSVVLRYFNVAGADQRGRTGQSTPNATHLFKVAAQVALGLRPALEIYGTDFPTADGTCIRDYIHVDDLVSAHVRALDHLRDGGSGGTFNCGYGTGASVLEVIDAMSEAAGFRLPTCAQKRRDGDPAALVAVADKIRSELGWHPQHDSLSRIAADALRWERGLTPAAGGLDRLGLPHAGRRPASAPAPARSPRFVTGSS